MTKRESIATILVAFGEATGRNVTELLINAYAGALENFTVEQIERAAGALLKTARFFPLPVDFIEAIEGSPEDRAAQAWGLLVDALRRFSAWESLQIDDDPAFVYAVQQVFGSWIRAGDTLPDSADPMFASLRKQFMGTYRAFDRSGQRVNLPHRFAGRHEANNLESFATWQVNKELPPQGINILRMGVWFKATLCFNPDQGLFQVIQPARQLGNGGQ